MEEKKEKEDLRTDRKLFLHLKLKDEYLNQKKNPVYNEREYSSCFDRQHLCVHAPLHTDWIK